MRVLSPYDGMSCGMLALQKAGIHVERYVAYEIDKYAIQTSKHNFPMIEHRGDVFDADFTEFEGFDGVIGGSPCTKWSIAQKNGRETEASGEGWEWFQQYVRAIREAKPKWFIYENNKSMSKAIRASIDEAFGFEAICINSSLVSAQNRQRLYWVGVRNEDGTYSKVPVEQPEDLGILLRDVLESGCCWKDKAYTIDSNYHKTLGQQGFDHQSGRRKMVAEPVNVTDDGKSQTIKAQYNKNSVANFCCYSSTYGATGVAEPVRIPEYGVEDKSRPVTACYAYKGCGEGSLATECFPDNPNKQVRDYVAEAVHVAGECCGYAIACEWDEGGKPVKAMSGADGKTYDVYEVKDGYITIKGKKYRIKLADGYYIIRKLTVRECMRLQTVPEWFEFPVSDTRAYQLLGNGWTISAIHHLLEAVKEALNYETESN